MNALATWIESKPGPFSGRTHDDVWDMAWKNFCAGPTGGLANRVKFMMHLGETGIDVRPTALGGYVLERTL